VAEIVAAALRLFARHPVLFILLAFAVVAPYELGILAATGSSPLGGSRQSASTTLTLALVDVALVGPLVSALDVHAVVMIGQAERPKPATVARRGLRVLPVVAAAQIVAALGIAIGLFAFIIPGVFLLIRWAVVAQVAAIERTDWLGALRRSGELVRGEYLHVFGLLFVAAAFNLAVTLGAEAIVGTKARAGDVVLGIAAATLTRSFTALATAILFFDLIARSRDRQAADA
jgi:hypothetical protein